MCINRIVSLDLRANVSSEVEILCNVTNCGLVNPYRMAVVKNLMYVLQDKKNVSVFEGKSNNACCNGKFQPK